MKKSLSLAFAIIILTSCIEDNVTLEPLNMGYLEVLNSTFEEGYKWYISATPIEQKDFWHFKINNTISGFEWSENQKQILTELQENLNSNWFELEDQSYTAFEQDWKERALRCFSKRDLYYIVCTTNAFSITDNYSAFGLIGSSGGSIGPNDETKCECSEGSDYCGAPLGLVDLECKKGCELTTERGCGTLLLYDCDGTCW